ncbi:hypothetical protein Emtol_3000 [Emticicia oligotrophica DSM 17448]|uniref:Single-stranded DNA-binding protein n=1 Tax=Emticicia oligotrophica (strain DSM 17448 / CIP 109782 / MTCC 6937 / GPTSA100-15) TaxID=929562 RepID=A0ABN4AP46_EMTOG|nr:DUF3127 domain-containing protein [Emticicia oligotrophica]AFK04133.1 hypothetical protein Emtol_3000 [Emticicia oligotrophica DSM 17448]
MVTLTGKITDLFPERSIDYKSGEKSSKMEFLLSMEGKFPTNVVVEVWNDKIKNPNLAVGNEVEIGCYLGARKFEGTGRWFNNLKLHDLRLLKKATAEPVKEQPTNTTPTEGDEPPF